MGAFMAIGTVFMMLYNGIMVGTFQQFFIERDLFKVSFLTIWQHGTLEISAIIIAGAAGLTLGRGLLFPGTFTRFQAFRISAKRGMKIMVGIFPVIVLAGFIEGFFTRYTHLPDLLRLSVILVSLAFVLLYFVWYPIKVARSTPFGLAPDPVSYRQSREIDPTALYSNGELFENTFLVLRQSFRVFFWISLAAGFLVSVAFISLSNLTSSEANSRIIPVVAFYDYAENFSVFVANVLVTSGILLLVFWHIKKHLIKTTESLRLLHMPSILVCLVSGAILHTGFFLPITWAILLFIVLFPIISFAAFASSFVNGGTAGKYYSGLRLFFNSLSIPLALYAKILGVVLLMMILLSSQLFKMNLTFILWNFESAGEGTNLLPTLVYGIVFHVFLFLGLLLILLGLSLSYFSVKEGVTSNNLKARIKQMGSRKKVLGYERE
jgi:hypothetical protein